MQPKFNRSDIVKLWIAVLISIISACASTKTQTYRAAGDEVLCENGSNEFGYVAVLPEAVWRSDQKEPQKRQLIAAEEIEDVFKKFPCGTISKPGGIGPFSNWSNQSETEILKQFSSAGVDTIILLRIEKLTPTLFITWSLPILWGGSSEADFRIRALAVKTGSVIADMRVRRVTGGAFNLRRAEWARHELNRALKNIIFYENDD